MNLADSKSFSLSMFYMHILIESYNRLSSKILEKKIMGLPGQITLRCENGTVVIAKDKYFLITEISRQDGNKCSNNIFTFGDALEQKR